MKRFVVGSALLLPLLLGCVTTEYFVGDDTDAGDASDAAVTDAFDATRVFPASDGATPDGPSIDSNVGSAPPCTVTDGSCMALSACLPPSTVVANPCAGDAAVIGCCVP